MSLRILPCGDRAALAEYGNRIDPAISARVVALRSVLLGGQHPGILQVTPGYRSALVEYDPLALDWEGLTRLLAAADREAALQRRPPSQVVRVPVVYGGEFGPDLPRVCEHTGFSPDEVIERHTAPEYLVYCNGFVSGFPFLGGLDPALYVPRLASPRTLVPAGSVGIGGAQTGVYPTDLPGGWNLIGHTPLRFFDPDSDPPVLVAAGDYVRFFPVSPDECDRIAEAVAEGVYQVERTQRP